MCLKTHPLSLDAPHPFERVARCWRLNSPTTGTVPASLATSRLDARERAPSTADVHRHGTRPNRVGSGQFTERSDHEGRGARDHSHCFLHPVFLVLKAKPAGMGEPIRLERRGEEIRDGGAPPTPPRGTAGCWLPRRRRGRETRARRTRVTGTVGTRALTGSCARRLPR